MDGRHVGGLPLAAPIPLPDGFLFDGFRLDAGYISF